MRAPPERGELNGERLKRASLSTSETRFNRSAPLDVAAAGRATAIAINRRCLAFAFAVGAAILAALVRRAIASGMRAFLFLVSHFFDSPYW
jgi:hypothetical protein